MVDAEASMVFLRELSGIERFFGGLFTKKLRKYESITKKGMDAEASMGGFYANYRELNANYRELSGIKREF